MNLFNIPIHFLKLKNTKDHTGCVGPCASRGHCHEGACVEVEKFSLNFQVEVFISKRLVAAVTRKTNKFETEKNIFENYWDRKGYLKNICSKPGLFMQICDSVTLIFCFIR